MTKYLAIFRVPDEDGKPRFVELPISLDEISVAGETFSVDDPDDAYNSLRMDQIVIAKRAIVNDSDGSIDIAVFFIVDDMVGGLTVVHEMNAYSLTVILKELLQAALSPGQGATLQ